MSKKIIVEAKTLVTQDGYKQHSAADTKEHYTAIVMGAGLSGMATAIQLKRKFGLGLEDVLVYERSDDVGGTWSVNRYPGAACDVPFSFYSFSFAPAYDIESQWATQESILKYLHDTQEKFTLNNICFRNAVETATFSRETGLWTLVVRDVETDTVRTRTCNILLSCLGGLTVPNDAPFDTKPFDGPVFHSSDWPRDLKLEDKNVVLVGNGCTAVQILPNITEAKSVTQVSRSRQAIMRRVHVPDNSLIRFLLRWIPGYGYFLRCCMYWIMESHFQISHIEDGAKERTHAKESIKTYIQEAAPKEYWNKLYPNFDVSGKRRVFDSGYYSALGKDNVELVADDEVVSAKGKEVLTKGGKTIKADVIVLANGFKVRDYFAPLKIYNDKGEDLKDLLMSNGVRVYQATVINEYPNFFWIMGPNAATGHSSVLFTSEAQLSLTFHMIAPVLAELRKVKLVKPAPYVEVTQDAQERYWQGMRAEMKKRIWEENGGVSWYVDKQTGYCTALYPWSQTHFWRKCTYPTYSDFAWTNSKKPAGWKAWFGWV
ncbi:hypothetical protein JCM11641_006309 [Rhodosporidiobolus odoratus]